MADKLSLRTRLQRAICRHARPFIKWSPERLECGCGSVKLIHQSKERNRNNGYTDTGWVHSEVVL